jgi:hypothetical protein
MSMNSPAAANRSASLCTVSQPKLLAERASAPVATHSATRPPLSTSIEADERAVVYGSACAELTVATSPMRSVTAAR